MQHLVDDKYHPILQLSCVKKIYEEVIETPKGAKKERLRLIITSVGLLLFKKHAFPASFTITHAISPELISSLTLDQDKITIPGPKTAIILTPNAPKIVAILSAIRNALFGPITIQYGSESLKQAVAANNQPYKSDFLISDRFLTYCLDTITNNQISSAQDLYNLLKNVNSSIVVTPDIISSPLSMAYIGALCTISLPFKLVVTKQKDSNELADYSLFVPLLSELFKKNSAFNSLEFRSITFERAKPKDKIFNDSRTETQVTSLEFTNCNMPISFKIFLDDFRSYSGTIQTLKVAECNFTEESFLKFIMILSSSPCFLQMVSVEISDVENNKDINFHISQYLNSNELRLTQTLKSIRIANANVDIDVILSYTSLFNPSIEEIHFINCRFLQKLPKSDAPISFQQIKTFDFGKSTFSFEGLRSLFNELHEKDGIKNLILPQLKFSDEIMQMYRIIGKYKLTYLESFDYSMNLLPQTAVDNFCEFISNMKQLKHLNITGVIPSAASDNIYKIARTIYSLTNLKSLVFNGVQNSEFGENFNRVLEQLPQSVNDLDISGQQIGNSGMNILATYLSINRFVRIRFANPNCTNDEYFKVLNEMISENSIVEDAVWNNEIDALFTSQSDKERINNLKATFDEKFVTEPDSLRMVLSTRSSRSKFDLDSSNGNLNPPAVIKDSSGSKMTIEIHSSSNYHEILKIQKDTPLYEMLVDCVGQEKADSSPLENILTQLEKEASFEI